MPARRQNYPRRRVGASSLYSGGLLAFDNARCHEAPRKEVGQKPGVKPKLELLADNSKPQYIIADDHPFQQKRNMINVKSHCGLYWCTDMFVIQ